MLIASRTPTGGLWRWDGGDAPARQVAVAPDTAFALPLADGRVVTLGGEEEGHLRLLERTGDAYAVVAEIATGGGEPCHAALLPDGEHLVVVNYHLEGSVLVVALAGGPRVVQHIALDGPGAGVVVDRQEAPHPHFALVVDDENVLVSDLGRDRLLRLRWRDGTLEQAGSCATPPGSGPRHLAIYDEVVVASAELSNEVLAAPLADVLAGEAGWSAVPASGTDLSAARDGGERLTHPGEIVVASTGRVYVANRGAGTLGVLDVADGAACLSWDSETDVGGAWPQHVLLQDDKPYVALRDDDLVVGPSGRVSVPSPVWLATSS
ncbi:NHL repeat containing protein [Beutenbergia cavernae DSM 12333]|uniref:NHL repeat containing protein n=1 Tax=Beutenbergia cavernae (strain ATCC BAA-8 / DSM 12333 / CCUG 43141 / JCM 11478 / NBRC 16432 / NCIMB 13614 / HKI 0122) TaxID=471853 RepID=C5BZN8_BEUC1|nr:beta-propeller fold lactonase family protein [Beutenbergia cavernae]ACQ81218.1 NHL repeat containing protein [Beutenbergia cavernae DSM 12333]